MYTLRSAVVIEVWFARIQRQWLDSTTKHKVNTELS